MGEGEYKPKVLLVQKDAPTGRHVNPNVIKWRMDANSFMADILEEAGFDVRTFTGFDELVYKDYFKPKMEKRWFRPDGLVTPFTYNRKGDHYVYERSESLLRRIDVSRRQVGGGRDLAIVIYTGMEDEESEMAEGWEKALQYAGADGVVFTGGDNDYQRHSFEVLKKLVEACYKRNIRLPDEVLRRAATGERMSDEMPFEGIE